MKLFYILLGALITKIAVFDAQKTLMWSYKTQYTHYVWLFPAIAEI